MSHGGMEPGSVVLRGLRTSTGLFFVRFFIGVILGLVDELRFIDKLGLCRLGGG